MITRSALGLSTVPGPEPIVLEALFVLEAVAPGELHVERFLPPTPVRVLVSNRCEEVKSNLGKLGNAPVASVLGKSDLGYKLFPRMLEQAERMAESRSTQIVAGGLRAMQTALGAEVERLKDLRAINPNVRQSEIDQAQKQIYDLRDHLAEARVRLDSVRLIFRASRGAAGLMGA